jgi:cell division protein FtsB
MKKIIFVAIVVILLLIINNLVRSMWDIWQKKDIISQVQSQLSFQKQENQRLKASLSYAQTPEFIEKEARDKLFMAKKGEQKVLVPQDSENSSGLENQDNEPNWKKWWNLFF